MPIYRVTVEGKDYRVEVPDPSERPVRAIIDGELFAVEIEPAAAAAAMPAPASVQVQPTMAVPQVAPAVKSSSAASGAVTAPLPGTIVGISVSTGDAVVNGQELCVLEAMKMNNPIRATYPGVVKEILVTVGQQVQHGAPLMVIAEA